MQGIIPKFAKIEKEEAWEVHPMPPLFLRLS